MDTLSPNDRITLIFAIIAVAALFVGFVANAFLRLRARRYAALSMAGSQPSIAPSLAQPKLNSAEIAEQALGLVDQVRAENQRLRKQVEQLQTQLEAIQQPVSAEPMPPEQWLEIVNQRPDQVPHLMVYGPSGVGKTTLVQAIVASRPDKLYIIDPKPTRPSVTKWGGLPYIRIDEDGGFSAIERALQVVKDELTRRLSALHRDEELEPVTIILDEYKLQAQQFNELAPEVFTKMSDFGRELKMRLIVLSTTNGVKGLKIEGMGDTRDNFVTIKLNRQYQAQLLFDDQTYLLDTSISQAKPSIPADRWWQPPLTTPDADAILSKILGEQIEIPVSPNGAQKTQIEPNPDTSMVGIALSDQDTAHTGSAEDTGEIPPALTDEMIRTLYAAGWSKNKIASMLRGSKNKRLSIINHALAADSLA
jgi:GTPase SAR1 family protein